MGTVAVVGGTFRFKLKRIEPGKQTSWDPKMSQVPKPRAVFFWSVWLSILPDQTFFLVSTFICKQCLVSLFLLNIWKAEWALPVVPWTQFTWTDSIFCLVTISAYLHPPWRVYLSFCEPGKLMGLSVFQKQATSKFGSVCVKVLTPLRLRCEMFLFWSTRSSYQWIAFRKGTRLLTLENADDILGEARPAWHNTENTEN